MSSVPVTCLGFLQFCYQDDPEINVGPGTQRPIGFTLDEFAELWRARLWKVTITSSEPSYAEGYTGPTRYGSVYQFGDGAPTPPLLIQYASLSPSPVNELDQACASYYSQVGFGATYNNYFGEVTPDFSFNVTDDYDNSTLTFKQITDGQNSVFDFGISLFEFPTILRNGLYYPSLTYTTYYYDIVSVSFFGKSFTFPNGSGTSVHYVVTPYKYWAYGN